MTDDKIREVIASYRRFFSGNGIQPVFFGHDGRTTDRDRILEHCCQMLDKMEQFLQEGRRDKVFRWLGFLQGCLFATGQYSIGEMADHNRPDPEP